MRGLSAGDLKLEVDGREVPIEYFSEIEDGRPVPAPSASSPAAEGAAAAGASSAPQGRSLLVFIDEAFAVAKQRDAVLQAIERDLKLLGPEDRMAIVAFGQTTIGGRLDVLSGWTGDRGALAAALKAARERPASGNDVLATRRSLAEEEYLAGVVSAPARIPTATDFAKVPWLNPASLFAPDAGDSRLSSWLDKLTRALVATMNGMAPPSGRRTLLLLSGGWPSQSSHIPLAIAANRLGYTVYPVDRGFRVDDVSVFDAWRRSPAAGWWSRELDPFREVVADTGSLLLAGLHPRLEGGRPSPSHRGRGAPGGSRCAPARGSLISRGDGERPKAESVAS